MKKILIIVAAVAVLVLFSGCELWLFVEGGGGVASGIGVYADISVAGVDVADTKELRALLFQKGGATFDPVQEKVGTAGSNIFQDTFKNVDTGTYKIVVYYDSLITDDSEDSPDWGTETGFTSNEFFYQSGDYEGFVIDEAIQWDVNDVQRP